jgi:hypothetical protein
MIPHIYVNASEDPAASDADTCSVPRQAVTMAFAWDHLVDQTMWVWLESQQDMDPWLEITGMDKLVRPDEKGNAFIIEWGTGSKHVGPEFRLFVQRRDLKRLGLPEGESGGFKTGAEWRTKTHERSR